MGHIAGQTHRAVAGLGIRSCTLVCCSRSCPLASASQKLSNIVLFKRCCLDIEQFQTHHFQEFLVTSNGVESTTSAFIDGLHLLQKQLDEQVAKLHRRSLIAVTRWFEEDLGSEIVFCFLLFCFSRS